MPCGGKGKGMNSYKRRKAEIAELKEQNSQLFRQLNALQSRIRDAVRATGMLIQDPISGDMGMCGNEEKYVPYVGYDAKALCEVIRYLNN